MKKAAAILLFTSLCLLYSCLLNQKNRQALYQKQQQEVEYPILDSIIVLPEFNDIEGNADSGYNYLTKGGIINSGIPYLFYKFLFNKPSRMLISQMGYNEYEVNDFAVSEKNGDLLASPGCLHCHAQIFDGKLVIGLGNSYSKFQVNYTNYVKSGSFLLKTVYGKNSKEWKNLENISSTTKIIAPHIVLEMQGPNPAHRIGDVIASHRNPQTLKIRSDTSYYSFPAAAVPTDVTAWWLAKKKGALYVSGFGRGNLVKQSMIATLLSLEDSAEASILYEKMKDIWAYLQTLEPPEYPYPVDKELVEKGEKIFNGNCSGCHGKYGKEEYYVTQLIPQWMVGTDSLFLKYYSSYNGFENWYNNSWFAKTDDPAFFKHENGYIAQPLDGIWITAPYFHNGSVPTLEGVLNSKIRPRYWKRNFDRQEYNYENPGWKYETVKKPGGKNIYNTDIPGYGKYGHYFGDHLSDKERKALIEYLKTI